MIRAKCLKSCLGPDSEKKRLRNSPAAAAAAAKLLQSCPTLCDPTRLHCPWDSPGKNTKFCRLIAETVSPWEVTRWRHQRTSL